jgi:calcineurin-like phosphoesterase family protein
MLVFLRKDGVTPLRPFSSVDEMDEEMIKKWNSVVKDGDFVYHLGDVCLPSGVEYYLTKIRPRLKGKMRLIIGNHDPLDNPAFMASFEKTMYWKPIKEHDIVAAHMPMMPSQFRGKCVRQVHGHIHEKHVRDYGDFPAKPLWACVSVECINYTPLSIEELDKYFVV